MVKNQVFAPGGTWDGQRNLKLLVRTQLRFCPLGPANWRCFFLIQFSEFLLFWLVLNSIPWNPQPSRSTFTGHSGLGSRTGQEVHRFNSNRPGTENLGCVFEANRLLFVLNLRTGWPNSNKPNRIKPNRNKCIHCIHCWFYPVRFFAVRSAGPEVQNNWKVVCFKIFRDFRCRAGSNWTCEPPCRFANLDRYEGPGHFNGKQRGWWLCKCRW